MDPSFFKKQFLPVYNIGDAGQSKFYPFLPVGLTEQAITWSTNIQQVKQVVDQLTDDLPVFAAKIDAQLILHQGDDTAFNQTFIVRPNQSLDIIKCFLSIMFAINTSAYTSGGATFQSVTLTVTKRYGTLAGDKTKQLMKENINTGFDENDTVNDIRALILQTQFDGDMIDLGEQIEFNFVTNFIQDLTNTIQIGIIPLWSKLTSNVDKIFSINGLNSHELPRINSKRVVLNEKGIHID